MDSGAELTELKCLLIAGELRNGTRPGPMGIHSCSCCGKEATSPEATMSLTSWVQVQPLPLEKRDLQSQPTCYQSTETSWIIAQASSLELHTGEPQVLIGEGESELCSRSNSNGGLWRTQGLSLQHSDDHGNYTHVTPDIQDGEGSQTTPSENS